MLEWADQNIDLLIIIGLLLTLTGSALLSYKDNRLWFMWLSVAGATILTFGIAGVADVAHQRLIDRGELVVATVAHVLPPLFFVTLVVIAIAFMKAITADRKQSN